MYAKFLQHHLSLNPDNEVEVYHSAKEFLDNLYRKPDVITLDYSLPDLNGEAVLQKVKGLNQDIPVVIVSGQEDINTAVSMLKKGAYDYIVKDDNAKDRIWQVINNIRENFELRGELDKLRAEVKSTYDFSNIKGNSPAIKKVFQLIQKAAQTNITVSITGETGTGKEMVAKAIHYNSNRSKNPFVAVNIAAIPNDLIESELFGHEKGAFTGAVARRIGKFEEANGGTLFLDEIGEMDVHLQAKLLRAIQEREINRIGSNASVKYDARIIVATHRNLVEEVKAGRFREDLYYRLLGLPIELPPLRARDNDILLLAKSFLEEFCKDNGLPRTTLGSAAQDKLLNYPWPGNVRELKAVIELAAVLADDGVIESQNITFNSTNGINSLISEGGTLRDYTIKIVEHYLARYNQNVVKVAEVLDVGKSTIYRMIKNNEITLN